MPLNLLITSLGDLCLTKEQLNSIFWLNTNKIIKFLYYMLNKVVKNKKDFKLTAGVKKLNIDWLHHLLI